MTRTIDNLENAFNEMFDFITDLPSGLDGFESDFDSAFKELEKLKSTLTQPNNWISAKDRLPDDKYGFVLVVANGKYKNVELIDAIMLAEYYREEGWVLEMYPEWKTPEVSHWIPLPEPPIE